MRAQLASPDAFKQAGLDYAASLKGIRFALDKRTGGQAVIRLTSATSINDPFVDMLVELNWPTGRLVREYTFLLDPPEIAARNAQIFAPPVTTGARVTSGPATADTPPAALSISEETRSRARMAMQSGAQPRADQPARATSAPEKPKSVENSAESGDSRLVRPGETLRKIAGETKPEGVTLEQMLVGLLRANKDAFDGGNMNRLKAGRILAIPDRTEVESVAPAEAKKTVTAQTAEWNAYRNRLAAVAAQSPASEGAAQQEAAGKITAKVEDKLAAPVEPKDQVKVSKSELSPGKAGSAGKSGKSGKSGQPASEDDIARDKALKEATERVAMLEQSVAKLQKLLELKEQNLAELQKQATLAKSDPAKPAEPPKPVEAPKPVEPAKAMETPKPAELPKPVEPAKVVEPPKPVEPVKPVESVPAPAPSTPTPGPAPAPAPTPVADAKPAPAPKPPPKPVPPPPPEPSFLEELADNPMVLAGGAGVLALLGAFLFMRRRRAGNGEPSLDPASSMMPPLSSDLTANSVFRSTGGQSVDTSHTPQTDFSQAGPGSIDTDEVDPVAEADVYMAYGRDAQAEEILLEAKQKDAKRYAIHLKLLEIYANRKDLKQFEPLAAELFQATGGLGPEWEKAAAMGHRLDAGNPLFGGVPAVAESRFEPGATAIVNAKNIQSTVISPAAQAQADEEAAKAHAPSEPVASLDLSSLDFDLGTDEKQEAAPAPAVQPAAPALDRSAKPTDAAAEPPPLDFDLAIPTVDAPAVREVIQPDPALDFSLPESKPASASKTVAAPDIPDLDFDLGFGEVAASPAAAPKETASAPKETAGAPDKTAAVPSAQPVVGAADAAQKASDPHPADDDLEFDVDLTASTFLGNQALVHDSESSSAPAASELAAASFDIKSIDLDLGSSKPVAPPVAPVKEAALKPDAAAADAASEKVHVSTVVNPEALYAHDAKVDAGFGEDTEVYGRDTDINANQEVATKLDLANAYEEMGDLEGARELLQEVVKEGNPEQREKAKLLLDKFSH